MTANLVDRKGGRGVLVDEHQWLEGLHQKRVLRAWLELLSAQRQEAEGIAPDQMLFGGAILCAIACLFALGFGLSLRSSRRKEIARLRNQISKDLHDEIGSSRCSIRLISEMSGSQTQEASMDREALFEIFRERLQALCIVVLTVFEDDDKLFRAICAGADGYPLKTQSGSEIMQSVGDALAGGSPINPRIARRVLSMFSKMAPRKSDYGLSPRERQVLELVVEGLLKKEIAQRLELSVHTVDGNLRRIYEKLHVNSRSGAVRKGLREGLV